MTNVIHCLSSSKGIQCMGRKVDQFTPPPHNVRDIPLAHFPPPTNLYIMCIQLLPCMIEYACKDNKATQNSPENTYLIKQKYCEGTCPISPYL